MIDTLNTSGQPDLILIGTGSELDLAVQAAVKLNAAGVATRVVSMPCTARFDAQDAAYRESVLPSQCRKRVAVEAASADYWWKYVGFDGAVIGMHSFGASAPDKALYAQFGITVDAILAAANVCHKR